MLGVQPDGLQYRQSETEVHHFILAGTLYLQTFQRFPSGAKWPGKCHLQHIQTAAPVQTELR
jgi:hypothetical protein